MRLRAVLISTLLIVSCAALTRLAESAHSSATTAGSPSILYTSTRQYAPDAWITGSERFPQGATIMLKSGQSTRPLVSGFASTADPNISFDGKSVVFAGKRTASDPWQIWELAIDGGEPRRIVSATEDLVRPMYLPEDRVVYARKRNGQFVTEAAPLAGGKSTTLFYAPGSALPTDVLRDGRILFEATYPLGVGATPELYTVYSDGSGVESYRCDHGQGRQAGKQVSSGDIIFAKAHRLARFTSPLAHDENIVVPSGEYAGDVTETSSGDWLLPWRADAKKRFELKQWTPTSRTLAPVVADPAADLVQPVLVAERAIPNRHPSGLHDWRYANLLTLNAYTSKYQFAAGSIAKVRLHTIDDAGKPKVLGTAPVELDGSFYLKVPGNQPLKFELLDAAGKTLKKQAGWMWASSGEQRICVGCHTGPERAPDNAVPAVLLRSTTAADMTGSAADTHSGGR